MLCGLNFKSHYFQTEIIFFVLWHGDECRLYHSREPRRPYLPYVIFTEVIWGDQRVQEIWELYRRCVFFFFPLFFFLGGVFVSLYCGHVFARTPCFSRALLRTATQDWTRHLDRREAKEDKRKRERAPGGQALVEVVVCAVGRVVILPLVEMTAQSTALPALVTCDGWIKQDQREWLSSLYCL